MKDVLLATLETIYKQHLTKSAIANIRNNVPAPQPGASKTTPMSLAWGLRNAVATCATSLQHLVS
jgi:hypothetical protein